MLMTSPVSASSTISWRTMPPAHPSPGEQRFTGPLMTTSHAARSSRGFLVGAADGSIGVHRAEPLTGVALSHRVLHPTDRTGPHLTHPVV
jgi:hypothetical protein